MAEQSYGSAPSRNTSRAVKGGGTIPGEISLGKATPGPKAPATKTGPSSSKTPTGFGGGLINPKIK